MNAAAKTKAHPRHITSRRLTTLRRLGVAAKKEALARSIDLAMSGAPKEQVQLAGRMVQRIERAFDKLHQAHALCADKFFAELTAEDDIWLPKWAQRARVADAYWPVSAEKAAQDAFEASGQERVSDMIRDGLDLRAWLVS